MLWPVANKCADSAELQGSDMVTITLKIKYSKQIPSLFTTLIEDWGIK
jgi:hypothetical protein